MKRTLVFYGYFERWDEMYKRDDLLKYLRDIIDDIIVIHTIQDLKKYLQNYPSPYKNYILPSRIHHIYELNEAGIRSLFSIDSYWLRKLEDKKLFASYVVENNLSKYVPTYFYKSSNRSNSNQLVIVKPKNLAYSHGIYKKRLCEVDDWEFDEHVVQEYIYNHKEYDAVFVANKGAITLGFAYVSEFERNDAIKFENGVPNMKSLKKVMLNDKINKIIEKFLRPCSYTGTCCFDFKINDGKLYIFEINPRLDGALASPWNKDNLAEVIRELIRIF